MTAPVEVAGKSAYDILQVEPGADATVVRTAYRERVKEVHPDAGGSDAQLQEVMEAFRLVQQNPKQAEIRPQRQHQAVLPRWRFYWKVSIFAALLVTAVVTVVWRVPGGASVLVIGVLAGTWLVAVTWYASGRMPPGWMLAKVPRPWRRS